VAQPTVVFSREARADLLQIEAYLAHNAGEQRAELALARIRSTITLLSYNPAIGAPRSYTKKGEFAFPVRPWIIIFRPLPDLDGIYVLRVVDGRRDLPRVI
jgi:plasmid stabilization system protein ParE